jgi:hypothetical protein
MGDTKKPSIEDATEAPSTDGGAEASAAEQAAEGVGRLVYASIGAGQVVVEKAVELSGKALEAARSDRGDTLKTVSKKVEALAGRGQELVSVIRSSPKTKTLVGQTKNAGQRVKTATTGARKVAATAAEAGKAAVKKTD